jgi:hypothetical protein
MHKFHQIPTDTFKPISHDNSYLFNHYDKVANFLAFNLDKNYKNILAKPVQNGFMFDWFSNYENLININKKNKNESDTELVKYWEFLEKIKTKITQLSLSNEENDKNWANLLTKVFNHNDNFIFSNGHDICIVWGWEFDNNENYKPNISKTTNTLSKPDEDVVDFNENKIVPVITNNSNNASKEAINVVSNNNDEVIEESPINKNKEDSINEESGFKKFLQWFASKFWWLLWILLFIIILFLMLKSCNRDQDFNEINTKLNQLEQKANDCTN